jgi:alpha-ribazole phosphatase/probable phosphoglycerate mutase
MEYTRLYIARHGQVTNHHEKRYNGHFDVDITDVGLGQMNRLADYLSNGHGHKIEAVYSSDLVRARKGAEIISKALKLECSTEPSLRELHLGRWEGLSRAEAAERYPEEAHLSFMDLAVSRLQGGESLKDLSTRVLPTMERLMEAHRGREICLVLHGGVNRVILCDAMGLSIENFFRIEQDYGCLNVIDCFSDGIKVVKMLNGGPNQTMQTTKFY